MMGKDSLLYPLVYYTTLFLLSPFGDTFATHLFMVLEDDDLPCPSLYIYSKDDELVEEDKVTELIDKRRRRRKGGSSTAADDADGTTTTTTTTTTKTTTSSSGHHHHDGSSRIDSWLIDSSPHVQHYLKHPQEYKSTLQEFLKRHQILG